MNQLFLFDITMHQCHIMTFCTCSPLVLLHMVLYFRFIFSSTTTQKSNFNSQNAFFGLKSQKKKKKFRQFHCTGLLCSGKLVHVDKKNLALFTQNLVQKRMRSFLASKTHRKWLKSAKNKQCSKNVNIRISWSKGQSTGNKSAKIPQTNFFRL